MIDNMAMEALRWIVHDIEERHAEALAERCDDFTNGRSLAYFEVVEMIQSRLKVLGITLEDDDETS